MEKIAVLRLSFLISYFSPFIYIYGATEGIRTPDLMITNQLLYQLSYGGDNRLI